MDDAQTEYDLVVLGTGSAGTKVAHDCRAEGWKVLIIEEREFGGTCALRGCEPKKTLWTVAEAADRVRRLGAEAGLATADQARIDWPRLMAFKRSFTDPVPSKRRSGFEEAGIDVLSGTGRFVAPDAISVGEKVVRTRHAVIATGAKPSSLPIEGFEHLSTSDDFLALDALPESLLVLGGGYISFELAHIAARAGARVTLLHKDQRPLPQFDADLVARLVEHTRDVGIAVELGAEVSRIEQPEAGRIVVSTSDGRRFSAGKAFHGLGRVPNIDRLDLDAAEVETDDGRLKLDAHLRSTSNPRVFAVGDAAEAGPPLTPVSVHDADCVAKNLLHDCTHSPDYRGVASVVFAIPPFAKVGMTEEEARDEDIDIEVKHGDMSDYLSVRREGHAGSHTAFKVILDRSDGCIVGAHLFAPGAHEAINLFALAARLRLTAGDLAQLLSAYPSEASNIGNMLA